MASETRSNLRGDIAFIFPGQGGQYVGMGKDLYEKHPEAREIFEESSQIVSKDISSLCFDGPAEELNQTVNTQIAVFVVDYACYSLLRERINPAIIAGHSLGEYPALVAAGAISLEEGLGLVKERARLMEMQARTKPGKMIAVLGLGKDKVVGAVDSLGRSGIMSIANYNCPGQVVVSGEAYLIDQAIQEFNDRGAKRVVELKVSGAFHSPLMKEAEEKFACFLKNMLFKDTLIPVVSNYTARATTEGEQLKKALAKQITGSVKWEQSIQLLIEKGISKFIELGPGRVLSGLIRRINPASQVLNVEDELSLNKTLAEIA